MIIIPKEQQELTWQDQLYNGEHPGGNSIYDERGFIGHDDDDDDF